jgi:SHS2 domain-containing protein
LYERSLFAFVENLWGHPWERSFGTGIGREREMNTGENPTGAPSQASCGTFAHGSDIGVRGKGPSLARAFEQVALALTSVVADPARVKPEQEVAIECSAHDHELLLLEWLDALIYEMATRRMLFSRFDVAIEEGRLRARAFGETVDVARHQPAVEVKGATCTELSVTRGEDGVWSAQCVVDV